VEHMRALDAQPPTALPVGIEPLAPTA
jgi:hypothetical protein